MQNNFFKTKKIFFLSLFLPVLIFVLMVLNYNLNQNLCTYDLKTPSECKNFLDYLNSISGRFFEFMMILSFFVSLLILIPIFFIVKKRK